MIKEIKMMHFFLTRSHTESSVERFRNGLAQIYLQLLSMKEHSEICISSTLEPVRKPQSLSPWIGASPGPLSGSWMFFQIYQTWPDLKWPFSFFQGEHYSKIHPLFNFSRFAFVLDVASFPGFRVILQIVPPPSFLIFFTSQLTQPSVTLCNFVSPVWCQKTSLFLCCVPRRLDVKLDIFNHLPLISALLLQLPYIPNSS